jgi:hypothetical protein
MAILSPTFFLTATLQLILFYRIVELVILNLVVSRCCVWCIVALAVASFCWPWHLLTSSSPPAAHVALVPRLTSFFPQPFHQQKWRPFWPFFLLRSSPMVELVQYSIAFIPRYKIHFCNHGGTSLFDPLTAIWFTIFALFSLCCTSLFQLSRWWAQGTRNNNNNQPSQEQAPPSSVFVHHISWSTLLNMVAKRRADELYISFRWQWKVLEEDTPTNL